MGSGTQGGLQVVVADANTPPSLRGSQDPIGEAVANSWLSQAGGVSGSGLKAATLALANSDAEVAARTECSKVRVKEKVKATRRAKAHTVTRTKTVCKTVNRDATQVAKAPLTKVDLAKADLPKTADCAALAKPKGRTAKAKAAARRAEAACKKENATAVASAKGAAEKAGLKSAVKEDAKDSKDSGGGYRIQVGAFDSKGAAQQHLTKISKQYGAVVSAASSQVQPASKGAYRARFSGFSAQGAKAACAALSAKGERCLVLSPG
jgi:hypothetical protein